MFYLCVTPDREAKTRMLMRALSAGFQDEPHLVIYGVPPDDGNPFAVWGQEWLTLQIVPPALKTGRPFWHIDNGFWYPGRGGNQGYYRFTYRGMTPILLPQTDDLREPTVRLQPWRATGRHVLFAAPGIHFGLALNLEVKEWCERAVWCMRKVCKEIGREFRVRDRDSPRPLAADLADCWALITHSSNVAVDAAIAGIPVFVQPTSPAAPIGRLDCKLDEPVRPPRNHWLRSLASQHFTVAEMADGIAWKWMQRIAAEVDKCR